ncbi:tumor necrosis factor ligand superfamily member 14-like [Bufo gargarizans]|uniref:tumor necrosis factor ligand superfamily member 14-like n=1 Tax=Bufo gargarizans TaxID=30331 RepID=UPI001CF55C83|nr:tumor necrosis factor ligand superfamily member 14-like [Bufo gargarizans]
MDRYGGPPKSVFTVEDRVQPSAPYLPVPLVRRAADRGKLLIQLVLLVFSLLALCGAASEIYFLMKVESRLMAVQNLIQEINPAQKMIFRPGSWDGPPMPSAHVTGIVVVDSSSNSPLQWEHDKGLAFLHEINYSNGSLLCPKDGLYFIYSKLQLGLSKCPQDTENVVFTHQVVKRSSTINISMLANIRRFCDTQGSTVWRGSSFVGGIFMLAKGEEVFVSMSHKHLIRVQGDSTTFFGMFMV